MKFGRKIFFTKVLKNSLGTFVGAPRDLFGISYEILPQNQVLPTLPVDLVIRIAKIHGFGNLYKSEAVRAPIDL